ncbi:MAG: hypothetical protein Ct9H300mP16_03670 [Pseudomonadota bacterium]|nr:MAG: hypothetical protein Ct9H300mP16_03670 [Pseudomonadota bacterium]
MPFFPVAELHNGLYKPRRQCPADIARQGVGSVGPTEPRCADLGGENREVSGRENAVADPAEIASGMSIQNSVTNPDSSMLMETSARPLSSTRRAPK